MHEFLEHVAAFPGNDLQRLQCRVTVRRVILPERFDVPNLVLLFLFRRPDQFKFVHFVFLPFLRQECIDADQRDVIPRRDRVWDLGGVATRMAAALEAAERPVPAYLKALSIEHDSEQLKTAVFGMFCFWTGEYELGSIDGVVTTEAGFYQGREVTLVRYHQKQIGLEQLIEEAAARRCAESVYIENSGASPQSRLQVKQFDHDRYRRAPSSDQKKQLQRWLADHQELQLTPQQLTKLNALMEGDREVALSWLSPRQRAQIEP